MAAGGAPGASLFSSGEALVAGITGLTDSLNRMQQLCFSRCCCRVGPQGEVLLRGPPEPHLEVWEKACVDRCVSKHMQTHQLVGAELAAAHSAAAAAAAAAAPAAAAAGAAAARQPFSFALM
ncbi:hypothetical protein, conserved [Eimeria tenella]|uniref:Mitochondrial import inner membrane translocase subunit n=1 Tax=Eimeria tenella TaxID=5802 RepID=U6KTC2_EIMTE|nr:hypothetical protein, conserved [Eimeria tenella]CDJ38750.1 hypothetical protein, conserved [Eimeria tenella]|eukprot:XP_013229506.1 hypothetical protein, conserved [Eimeria tenella]